MKYSATAVVLFDNNNNWQNNARCSIPDAQFTMPNSIKIAVKLFAAYQEAYNEPELILEFPENTPVSQVREHLIKEHPELEQWRDVTRFGINLNFVEPDTPLNDGDEVVLIPPVSGG